MIKARHPQVADTITQGLKGEAAAPTLRAAARARHDLTGVQCFEPPSWEALADGARPPFHDMDDGEPGVERHGWQHEAGSRLEREFRERHLMPHLAAHERALVALADGAHPENPDLEDDSPAPRVGWQCPASSRLEKQCASEMWPMFNQTERALMFSQSGPMCGEPFTCFPPPRKHGSIPSRFASCCCVVCSLFRSPRVVADVAVFSTLMAIIARRAHEWEFWAGGASLWRQLRHRFVGKLVGG